MTANRPEILAALESVARKANNPHNDPYEIQRDLINTPLIEREDCNWCSVYVGDTDDVLSGGNRSYGGNLNKIRCDVFKVVYWGGHPADGLVEQAMEDGEIDEDIEDIPDNIWQEGEEILRDVVEDEIEERLGVSVTAISPKSKPHSQYGGYVLYVRSKDRYSVDLTTSDPVARVIAA